MTRRGLRELLREKQRHGFSPFLLATRDFLYGVAHGVVVRTPAGSIIRVTNPLPLYLPAAALQNSAKVVRVTGDAAAVEAGARSTLWTVTRSALPSLDAIERIVDLTLERAEKNPITFEKLAPSRASDDFDSTIYQNVEMGWDVYIDRDAANLLEQMGLAPIAHGPLRSSLVLFLDENAQTVVLLSPLFMSETRTTETGRSTLVPAIWLEPISPQVILAGGLPNLAPKPLRQYRPGLTVDQVLGLDLPEVARALENPVEEWVHEVVTSWEDGVTRAIDLEGPPKLIGCLRLYGITEERILVVLHGYAEKEARALYERRRPITISPRDKTPLSLTLIRHADLEALREDFGLPKDPELQTALESNLKQLMEVSRGNTPQERSSRNPPTHDRQVQARNRPVPRPSRR